jgi:hypothetical protein
MTISKDAPKRKQNYTKDCKKSSLPLVESCLIPQFQMSCICFDRNALFPEICRGSPKNSLLSLSFTSLSEGSFHNGISRCSGTLGYPPPGRPRAIHRSTQTLCNFAHTVTKVHVCSIVVSWADHRIPHRRTTIPNTRSMEIR